MTVAVVKPTEEQTTIFVAVVGRQHIPSGGFTNPTWSIAPAVGLLGNGSLHHSS
jgi:hypothetical protein